MKVFIIFGLLFITNKTISQWSPVYHFPIDGVIYNNFWSIDSKNDSIVIVLSTENHPPNSFDNFILIRRSIDYGQTFDTVYCQYITDSINAGLFPKKIKMINDTFGIVAGENYNRFLITINAGQNWLPTFYPNLPGNGSSLPERSIEPYTDSSCLIGMSQYLFEMNIPSMATSQINTVPYGAHSISMPSQNYFYTTDGLSTNQWQTLTNYSINNALSFTRKHVQFFNDSTGIITGITNWSPQGYYGVVARTNNYGATWSRSDWSNLSFECMQFVNDSIGYAGSYLHKTIDRGQTWYVQHNDDGMPFDARTISCSSPSVCYAIDRQYKILYRTTNGGGPLIGLGQEDHFIQSFPLSPNPCTTTLTFSSVETPFQYQFYNLHGQEVISGTSTAKQLDVTALKPGMYFLKVHDRNGTRAGKVVKVV